MQRLILIWILVWASLLLVLSGCCSNSQRVRELIQKNHEISADRNNTQLKFEKHLYDEHGEDIQGKDIHEKDIREIVKGEKDDRPL